MKSNIDVYITLSLVLLLSLQYLLLSIISNDMAVAIIGNNPYINIFGTINNLILFLFPILLFVFLVLSTHLMLEVFDIKTISPSQIASIIGFSFMPLIIGMFFYNISLLFFKRGAPASVEDLENIRFSIRLTIQDFHTINKICWYLMYYLIFISLFLKFKISLCKSLAICLTPTLLVLFFCFLMNFL